MAGFREYAPLTLHGVAEWFSLRGCTNFHATSSYEDGDISSMNNKLTLLYSCYAGHWLFYALLCINLFNPHSKSIKYALVLFLIL